MENLNEKKQIEEMARIIGYCESTLHPDIECHNKATGCYCIENPCHNQRIADKLYNAGYRKQSDKGSSKGCEYCKGRAYTKKPLTVITKYGRRIELVFEFCPNCGRKMKGGAE